MRLIPAAALVALTSAALILPPIAAASAAATPSAVTILSARPDSGNGGTWEYDNLTRTITFTLTGTTGSGLSKVWDYTATLTDKGSGQTIKGALTPNQAPGVYAGDTIKRSDRTLIQGTARFSFTASQPVSSKPNLGVPVSQAGAGSPTSTWEQQAFPAGTVFGGLGLTVWSWTYTDLETNPFLFFGFPGGFGGSGIWTDSSSNGDGNLPGDGNIDGR